MIWCNFYHFRISGNIICRQLLHSFTYVMKGASPFWEQANYTIMSMKNYIFEAQT